MGQAQPFHSKVLPKWASDLEASIKEWHLVNVRIVATQQMSDTGTPVKQAAEAALAI